MAAYPSLLSNFSIEEKVQAHKKSSSDEIAFFIIQRNDTSKENNSHDTSRHSRSIVGI